MLTPKPFPEIILNYEGPDANPAIQLFGRRFFIDQSMMEYLAEFLLVASSEKRIGEEGEGFRSFLPEWQQLQDWPKGKALGYRAPARLGLKLFAFLGASKIETRHESHMRQYRLILERLKEAIRTDGTVDKEDILRALENLFLGFQGVGFNRTWCAKNFFPVANSLLMQETLWNESVANRESSEFSWEDVVCQFHKFFSVSKHRFMARGGELLYLQICNALRAERKDDFDEFISQLDLSEEERNPRLLHESLESNLSRITNQCPEALDKVAYLIDGIDGFTAENLNRENQDIWCAWCPEDSWKEGYLFAVEVNRLCQADIDPIERINLLIIGCALQVLRSLSAQSMRYSKRNQELSTFSGALDYCWIISSPSGHEHNIKNLSQRNLQVIQRTIQQALRHEDIYKNAGRYPQRLRETLYNEADTRYGHKLFLSLGKKLDFIVPRKGPGPRFVFNDQILRYLVLSLIRPGERRTFDDFKRLLYDHYGIAVEGIELRNATRWTELPQLEIVGYDSGAWLRTMLEASGFLIHLSDACSLVNNPFCLEDE
jgi:hypothetical protein